MTVVRGVHGVCGSRLAASRYSAAVGPSSRSIRSPRPASSTPAAAVAATTPSGKRRQAMSGTVEHAASTTLTRLSSPDPDGLGVTPPCESCDSDPTSAAAAMAASSSARVLGRAANSRCAVTVEMDTLRGYIRGPGARVPQTGDPPPLDEDGKGPHAGGFPFGAAPRSFGLMDT